MSSIISATTSVITTFSPIPDAVAFDLQIGCTLGGDFTKLLDRASRTLPEVSESTSPLSRIRALFNHIHSYDPSIEKALYLPDVKEKIKHPDRESFLAAVHAWDLSILQLYLESGVIISEEDRGEALCSAACCGDEAVVSLILANGSISEEDRGVAVRKAACYGREAVVPLILAHGSISEEDRGLAIRYFAVDGYEAMVSFLLAHGST